MEMVTEIGTEIRAEVGTEIGTEVGTEVGTEIGTEIEMWTTASGAAGREARTSSRLQWPLQQSTTTTTRMDSWCQEVRILSMWLPHQVLPKATVRMIAVVGMATAVGTAVVLAVPVAVAAGEMVIKTQPLSRPRLPKRLTKCSPRRRPAQVPQVPEEVAGREVRPRKRIRRARWSTGTRSETRWV